MSSTPPPPGPTDPVRTVEERDRQWLETVYRGDRERDLTPRAVLAGMVFGGLMSLSNLYVGLKSGWGLGVDIAAVIVIFAVFKALRGLGIVKVEFGLMENTIMMTVAVAASWISSAGLVSAVPALTMLTGYEFVWWQLALFISVILYLGLFMAIPFKRQMIQIDSLRFPANIPTGETLKAMYSHGGEAMKRAKALGIAGVLGMLVAGLRDGLGWIPGQLNLGWQIQRVSLGKLTLSLEPSLIFIGIGALFGIKVGLSMLFGLMLNNAVLAPGLINAKIIQHPPPQIRAGALPRLPVSVAAGQSLEVMLEEAAAGPELAAGATTNFFRYTWTQPTVYGDLAALQRDLAAPQLADGSPNPFHPNIALQITPSKTLGGEILVLEAPAARLWEARLSLPGQQPAALVEALGFKPGATAVQTVGGFRNISAWSLWPGATVLVVGGLLALALQWRTLGRTFASMFSGLGGRTGAPRGVLDHLEIPMRWFVIGFLVTGLAAMLLLAWLFSIPWPMGLLAVLMTCFLAAVAARAGAEIGINPIGALGKVTQLTYGVIAPGNIPANLMTAGVTAGAAASCSDTIGNLKVGHMVGANPRRQFIAQLFGVLAGSLLAVPAYFILVPDANALGGEKFPAPSALVWMGVAKVLSQGLSTLPPSAVLAMGIAFFAGVVIVVIDRVFPKARPYTPSPAALGIALTIPAYTSFAMFLGALIAWMLEKRAAQWNATYTIPIASGCIAGESIMGVILAALLAFGILG
jgi:uncharacterized oligopeptide transporter (OPT) family protein